MSDPFGTSNPAPGAPVTPAAAAPAAANVEMSPAVARFKSCRWRRPPEDGPECCGHRDVLPIAGITFNPEAWCPDCTFYKLRRTPKKRSPDDYRY
ncbi:MAG: hypothetical protein HY048_15895 [Acidobacteria bacterium]|nr:hypothetical protein [Acidobacteriota bacterium]